MGFRLGRSGRGALVGLFTRLVDRGPGTSLKDWLEERKKNERTSDKKSVRIYYKKFFISSLEMRKNFGGHLRVKVNVTVV